MTNNPQKKTKPWYEEAFGEDYLERYAHRDLSEARQAIENILLPRIPHPTECTILDLCCGAGRHSLIMREFGLEVVSGDLSMPLLREGKRAFQRKAVRQEFLQLDMRHIPLLDESVQLVANFFTAFGYFETDSENFSVFDEVCRVLAPEGWFVLDFINREKVVDDLIEPKIFDKTLGNGSIERTTTRLVDRGDRVEKLIEQNLDSPNRSLYREVVRLFSHRELAEALRRKGLHVKDVYGDYDAGRFDKTSPRLIICAKK